jgi:signal transduction histidine kinase
VRDLTRLLGRVEVRFARRFDSGHHLRGPASEWERVFMNLFLNAAQAMTGGGEIQVALERSADAVAITVMDEGPGISADILRHLFQPNVSSREEHSGLGLHIVDTIVRRQGGVVTAANRTDRPGAVFRISLPAD